MDKQDIARVKEVIKAVLDIPNFHCSIWEEDGTVEFDEDLMKALTTALEIISAYEQQEKELDNLKSAVNWQKLTIKARDEQLALYKGALEKIATYGFPDSYEYNQDVYEIAQQALGRGK